jgi:hypothetical protein
MPPKMSVLVSSRTSSGDRSSYYPVSKLKRTGSLLDRKPDQKPTVVIEETQNNNGARLETSKKFS